MRYRLWILIALLIFGAGVTLVIALPQVAASLLSRDIAYLQEMARIYLPMTLRTAVFIFFKNSVSLLVSFVLSPLFLIVPLVSLVLNGWLISFVVFATVRQKSPLFALLGILPHGILEIPAFVLGEAAALSFGLAAILAAFKHNKRRELIPSLEKNLLRPGVAILVLIPAALVETYVTPLLLK